MGLARRRVLGSAFLRRNRGRNQKFSNAGKRTRVASAISALPARNSSGSLWNCASCPGRFSVPDRFATALRRSLPGNQLGNQSMGGNSCNDEKKKTEN